MQNNHDFGRAEGEDSAVTFLFLLMIIVNALIITDLFLSILQSSVTLIFIRVALMLTVLGFLGANGLRRPEIRGRGWVSLLVGFGLVFLGSLTELFSQLPATSAMLSYLSPPVLNFLENIFFDLLGYFCLAYGFFLWIPSIIEARRRMVQTAIALERKVRERTRTLQETNEQLTRSKLSLENANRLKNEFLASVSHELKTPLNSILGYCWLLLEGKQGRIDPRQLKSIQTIDNNSRNLLEQINRILDFAHLESERIKPDLRDMEVAVMLDEVTQVLEPLARARGLNLSLDVSQGPHTVRTDPKLLRQLLLGILDNALKFTEKGEVKITTAQESDRWMIRVSDTGIGISEEELPYIFEPFRQGDGSLCRRFGGTGLGLTIALKLTNFLNGTVTVQSRPAEGSTFTVTLPLRIPESNGPCVNVPSDETGFSKED